MPKRLKFNDLSLRNIASEIYSGRAVVVTDRGEDVAAIVQYPDDEATLQQGQRALERLHEHGKSGKDKTKDRG